MKLRNVVSAPFNSVFLKSADIGMSIDVPVDRVLPFQWVVLHKGTIEGQGGIE